MSMTLDIYADVDPDAKRAAVDKVADSFDMDLVRLPEPRHGAKCKRWRTYVLGGPAQGDARCRRGEGG